MKHLTGSFKTADGVNIFTEWWLPDRAVKAVVLIVHGLAEYTGRYAHVAARLTADGYAVYGLDHVGHGKSDGLRAYFENFDQPVSHLKQFLEQVKVEQPGKKIFIYGHSLGSIISLTFLLRYQNEFAGAVISGTPLEVEGSQPKILTSMAAVMNNIAPKMAITPLDSKWLSHDAAVVHDYDNNPLIYRGNVRVRMGYQIMQVSRDIKAHMSQLTLPMLIVHGGEDRICPPSGSTLLSQGVGSKDKTLKMYSGLYHEVHNEIEKDSVLNDITTWLDAHV